MENLFTIPPQAELYRLQLRREQMVAAGLAGSPAVTEMDARIAALIDAGVPDGTHLWPTS